jgi:ribosome maturation factor RimP
MVVGQLREASHLFSKCQTRFADLSEALEVDNPFPGTCHPETSSPGAEAVLRNL